MSQEIDEAVRQRLVAEAGYITDCPYYEGSDVEAVDCQPAIVRCHCNNCGEFFTLAYQVVAIF